MVRHVDVGNELSRIEWESNNIHAIAGIPAGMLLGSDGLNIVSVDPADVSAPPVNFTYADITFTFGDGISAITPATEPDQWIELPFDCVITSARLAADAAGSFQVDIWRSSYADFPPTVANSLCATAKPNLSAAIKSENALVGWTTALSRGNWIKVHVESSGIVKRVVLAIGVTKS
jgi:hypothetical protein